MLKMERESVAYIPVCISRGSKLVYVLPCSPRVLRPACSQIREWGCRTPHLRNRLPYLYAPPAGAPPPCECG